MRGEQGDRNSRPSDEKFTDNSMFDIGKFQAFEDLEESGSMEYGNGGAWLGGMY